MKEHNGTIYTIRLCTSLQRRSALSQPLAGVQLCLIGKDGRAVLRRVSSEVDQEEQIGALRKICSVRGQGAQVTVLAAADHCTAAALGFTACLISVTLANQVKGNMLGGPAMHFE